MVLDHSVWMFAGAALLMAVTPGPNMLYLMSRSLCQGRRAGLISWAGVVCGFAVHVCSASFGLTALFMALPLAYEMLKYAGVLYLLWLAWQALRPGAGSVLQAQALPDETPRKLFLMGFLTNALNPKVAVFYMSILPQFIQPDHGSVLAQSLLLGGIQTTIASLMNLLIMLSASGIAAWFATHGLMLHVQRYLMGTVLAGLALRMLMQERSA
ncbi:MAG: LysE family translocator [Burkholderiales bacterium]|nr:LysE family translocator [Burkholderiales bacterium]